MKSRRLRLTAISVVCAVIGLTYSWLCVPVYEQSRKCCEFTEQCSGTQVCCSYAQLGAAPCSVSEPNYCRDSC